MNLLFVDQIEDSDRLQPQSQQESAREAVRVIDLPETPPPGPTHGRYIRKSLGAGNWKIGIGS